MISNQGEAVSHGGRHLPYQPALDGIRALAVAAVLAFHGDLSWARGGFLGVDAFFVLSGYLITSLLLLEWRARGTIALSAFWARRARRLLPALFLMLIGVGVYALAFADPLELDKIRGDALATIGYVANWRPIFVEQSYFDQFSLPSPLRHTWSLAIEEQYYAVWPLLLLVLLRLARVSLGKLLAISLVMIAASALLMGLLFQPGHDPSRVYYGTDTRAHSLLVGAALAMLLFQSGPLRSRLAGNLLQIAAVVCAVCIGWVWVVASGDSVFLYRGGFLLLAVAVAVVIAASVQPKAGPIGRVLSLPPLRGLGLISYGVYLWHWPIYLVLTPGRTGWDGYGLFAVRVLATLAIAIVSYKLIEMPIRRGAFRQWKVSWTLAPAGAAGLAVVLFLATRGAVSPITGASSVAVMPQISTVADSGPIRAILLGDSVALSVRPGLEQLGPEWNLSVWNRANLGCGFLEVDKEFDYWGGLTEEMADRCRKWREEWPSDVEAFRPDVVIMLFGAWDSYDRLVSGVMLENGTPEWDAYVYSGLEEQLDVFSAGGAKMLLATFPCSRPSAWDSVPDAAEREQETFWRINKLNEVYRRFAEEHPDEVVLADLNVFACPESRFTDLVIDGVRMRDDGTHFSEGGSDIVARWLAPQIIATADRAEAAVFAPTRVMLLGDSVALSMGRGLEREGPPAGLYISNKAGMGCGFLSADEEVDAYGEWSAAKAENCREWRSEWSSDVDLFQPDVVAFLFGYWDTLSLEANGRLLEVGTPEWNAYALEELGRTVDVLSARGAKVMLLTSPCLKALDLDVAGTPPVELNPQAIDELNDLYREFASQHPDQVAIVDLNRYVCPEGEYTDAAVDGVDLRDDGIHFTAEGADIAARWLVPQIVAVAQEGRTTAPGVGASEGVAVDGEAPACSFDPESASSPTPASQGD